MRLDASNNVIERRKKRMFIPAFYFLAEMVLVWLVLSIIQVQFDMREWSLWSVIIFTLAIAYSLAKTVHVYKRQKKYKS